MVMRWIVVVLLSVHGLIHVMDFAKAFGYAELPQLTQPVSREMGILWLAAGLLVVATAGAMVVSPRVVWMIGGVALIASQLAILSAWSDAKAGTILNVVLLLTVVHGWFNYGPQSFRVQFERDISSGLARPLQAGVVTEVDLAPLPEPVRHYLSATGVVGRPRVLNYRVHFRGRIRSGPESRWMPFEAEQQRFADEPARLFLMHARMFGLPVEVFHRRTGGHATMQVKIMGALPMVDARGEVMDRSEAVTLFNDMCLLAPGTLLDPRIAWEPVDARTARAHFTDGAQTISATLLFGGDGLLTNFISDDRSRSSPDGKTFTRLRFSTPARDYRDFGAARLASYGEARWTLLEGEFTYGEFEILSVTYNVR
jgi:hypothetical protein